MQLLYKVRILCLIALLSLLASCQRLETDCSPPGEFFEGSIPRSGSTQLQDSIDIAELHVVGWKNGDSSSIYVNTWGPYDTLQNRIRFDFYSYQDSIQVFYKDSLYYQVKMKFESGDPDAICNSPKLLSKEFILGTPGSDYDFQIGE